MTAAQIAALIRAHQVSLVTARCACGAHVRPRYAARTSVQQAAIDHVAAVLEDAIDVAAAAQARLQRGAAHPYPEPVAEPCPRGWGKTTGQHVAAGAVFIP